MIPTAILLGFVFGLILRWWAVPVVAVIWGVIILFIEPSVFVGATLLGAVNAVVGVVPAVGVRRLTSTMTRSAS